MADEWLANRLSIILGFEVQEIVANLAAQPLKEREWFVTTVALGML